VLSWTKEVAISNLRTMPRWLIRTLVTERPIYVAVQVKSVTLSPDAVEPFALCWEARQSKLNWVRNRYSLMIIISFKEAICRY
jgi:hypothetical protein